MLMSISRTPGIWRTMSEFSETSGSPETSREEGCKVCCKYMVHYVLLAKEIQFVGRRQGARCIKQNTDACPRSKRINRMQEVTQEFKQHCIKITHNLYSRHSIKKSEFIETLRDRLGNEKECRPI